MENEESADTQESSQPSAQQKVVAGIIARTSDPGAFTQMGETFTTPVSWYLIRIKWMHLRSQFDLLKSC